MNISNLTAQEYFYLNQDKIPTEIQDKFQELVDQLEEDLYSNSKSAHDAVEKYFMKHLAKFYKGARIVSVTYN